MFETLGAKLLGDDDERAVSPVIGVILMVAITVILAAVIAAFVLDMGDMGDQPPSTQFSFDEDLDDTNTVTVSVSGGENIDGDNLYLDVGDLGDDPISQQDDFYDGGEDWEEADELSAGDEVELEEGEDYTGGDTIQIIWEGDGDSQVLDEFETSD
ncbi:hypothetical protein GCM10009647_077990 [Streptomyces sanglieri]